LPSVNRLYGEFKAKGLEVLLVTFRESAAPVKKTAQERGYTAPVLLDASGDVTGRVYGVRGPPTAYLIDRQGRLVGLLLGSQSCQRRCAAGRASRDADLPRAPRDGSGLALLSRQPRVLSLHPTVSERMAASRAGACASDGCRG
jgi:AhpC/TSA family